MSTPANHEAIKVLLVEDNPGDARLVQEMLRNTSPDLFQVTWVERLSEAAARLEDEAFDIILLDLSLPDALGLETLTRMHNVAQKLPIIVLTGRGDEAFGIQALGEGAQDYLLKQDLDSFLLKRMLHYAIERKRVEQVERESEERFQALVQNSTDVITILAADMTVLYESPSLEKITGYKPEAVQGLSITDIIHPDDLPSVSEGMTTIFNEPAQSCSIEVRLRHADGSWRTQEATLTNLLNHPAIHGIVVNSRDITERKRSEEALRESESRYHRVLDSLLEGAEIIGFDWRYLYVNDASAMHGRQSKDVLLRSTVTELYPGIENTEMFAVFRTCMEARIAQHFETEFIFPDGTKTWFDLSVQPIPEGIFILSLDITERQQTEETLRQYNRRLGVLHEIDRGILTAELPQKIAERVAESLTKLIPCDAVRIIALDSNGKTLPYLAAYPPASQASHDLLWQVIESQGLPESFRRGEALRIDDTQTDEHLWPGFEEILTAKGARSWIIAPLLAAEQLVGILAVGSLQPLAFTSQHVEVVHEVADQLAIALHKNHLDEQIQEHARRLEARVAERTEQLHSEKERTETILMSASDAMIVANLDGSIQQVNTAFTVLFGYTLEQARAVSLYSLLDSASADRVHHIGAELAQGGQTQHVELVGLRRDGTLFDADTAFAPVMDGLPTILICSIRDITEGKVQERLLRFHASLQENVTDAVIATDLEFRIQSWNRAAEQIYGWRAEEVLGKQVGEILLTTFASDELGERVQRDFMDKGFWSDEVVQQHKDGHKLQILSSTVLFKDESGQPFGLVAVNHDITERKQVEEAVRESEARYRLLADNITDMVTRLDPSGIYIYLSPSTRTLLGYEPQELIGRSSFELIHPDDIDILIQRQRAVFDPNVTMSPSIYRMRHKAGHYIWVETRGQIIWADDKTRLLGFITASRDITERRLAEEALQQAFEKEKNLNELKTRFVSMVSHDFRTPLASIQSSSDLLRNYSERMDDEKKQKHFTTINGQIKHLTGLLEDMLTITKADSVGLPFHPVLTELGVFCQTIVDEMQALAGTHQIRFSINRPGELIRIDPELLRRALVNLLSNAVKYSPEDGVAEISVSIGAGQVEIRIKDQGIGIPEDDQTHLFEIFHRATNVGQISGTGLGLAIVKRVVDAHRGTISVQSEVDIGSTFTICLPLIQAEAGTT